MNDIVDLSSFCYEDEPGKWIARIHNEEVFTELCSYRIIDITQILVRASISEAESANQLEIEIEVDFETVDLPNPRIYIMFRFRVELWAKPYGIKNLSNVFRGLVDGRKMYGVSYEEDDDLAVNGFGISVAIYDQNQKLKDAVESALSIFNDFQTSAEATAIDSLDRDNLVTMFSFPDHIRVACKQYLVYFGQFLLDLGVEADTEIKDEGQQTLFKVIPKDKFEALGHIKGALNTYLNAPAITDLVVQEQFTNQDVAITQWQANIMHLKSQLMLADAAIQMKDATIESLKLTNYQYQQLALQHAATTDTKNEEEVIKGVLSVKKLDGKGYSINLPEILRRLKRTFWRQ